MSAAPPARQSNAPAVVLLATLGVAPVRLLLSRFGLRLVLVDPGCEPPGSYWGAPEAGLQGDQLFARLDTPVHSVLHEAAHYICMSGPRRERLLRDAGGDQLEECAACYLQVVLADQLPAPMSRARMWQDMDTWGYSFREGGAAAWFEGDGRQARSWLQDRHLVDAAGSPTFCCRP